MRVAVIAYVRMHAGIITNGEFSPRIKQANSKKLA